MKKAILLVGLFLIGMSTQANVTTETKVYDPWGNYDRYLSTQSVKFFENGVLYEVFLDGSFTYALPNSTYYPRRTRVTHRRSRRTLPVHNTRARRVVNPRVHIDRFGVLHGIGITNILYKPNGMVKRIGGVKIMYRQGRMVSVGGMDVIYTRRGRVSHTIGHINHLNPTYGPCGIVASNYYGERFYGIDTRYGTVYTNGRRSGHRARTNDWDDDDWDDDDYTRGRRSRD